MASRHRPHLHDLTDDELHAIASECDRRTQVMLRIRGSNGVIARRLRDLGIELGTGSVHASDEGDEARA
jgi:hypothetical protein